MGQAVLLEAGLPVRLIRQVLPYVDNEATSAHELSVEFFVEVERYRDRLGVRAEELASQRRAIEAYLRRARTHR